MKNTIKAVLLTVASFMTGEILAQTIEYRERFTAGIKIGTNFSNVYDSEGEDFDADGKFGLATGLFFSIPVGTFLGIQPEILFSQKGFRSTGSFLGNPYEMSRTTNYLDIPLLVALKPVESVTILVGPQFSYLMSQTDKFSSSDFTAEEEEQFDNDDIRKNTVCFVGGFDVNVRHVVIGARAGWDLFNNRGDGSSDTPRYKNVWVQGTIGFRL